MAATTGLITVAEFRKLPEDDGPVYHELRHGEVVAVTRPKYNHIWLQHRLRDKLLGFAEGGFVGVEVPFRALPEFELRVADVAYVAAGRVPDNDSEEDIAGSPDLVIEVLSPSNTAAEINEKEQLCLMNGSREFWVVDPKLRQVRVSTPDGHAVMYRGGQTIPLSLFSGRRLAVDDIFA